MKILSAQQIREADEFTIRDQELHSSELMERASKVFSNWFTVNFNFSNQFKFIVAPAITEGMVYVLLVI